MPLFWENNALKYGKQLHNTPIKPREPRHEKKKVKKERHTLNWTKTHQWKIDKNLKKDSINQVEK